LPKQYDDEFKEEPPMNAQSTRNNFVSDFSARFFRVAALEKLRRIIFSPVSRHTTRAVAFILSVLPAVVFSQTTIQYDPSVDYTINENEILDMYDYSFKLDDTDYFKSVTTLNGGALIAPEVGMGSEFKNGTLLCTIVAIIRSRCR